MSLLKKVFHVIPKVSAVLGMVNKASFFEKFAPFAIQTMKVTKIPASITLAQAALESNWGKSAYGNNFFGIKGTGPAGTQRLWTVEVVKGKTVRLLQNFRKYSSPAESFLDHARVISTSRYLKHALDHTESAQSFINALQNGVPDYASDPLYSKKIMKLIRDYSLEKYDF